MSSVKVESYVITIYLIWFFPFLLIDLDDTEQNEKLKFSIVMRLPEVTNGFGYNFLDFGIDRKFLLIQRVKPMKDSAVIQIEPDSNITRTSIVSSSAAPGL